MRATSNAERDPSHREEPTYACQACDRCFIVLGPDSADVFCSNCGAKLVAKPLPEGMYELRVADPFPVHAAEPEAAPRVKGGEADLGYGESHGYGPAHGGPSGPADEPAPAKVNDDNGA